MARSTVFKWFALLILYFVFLSTLFYAFGNITQSYNLNNDVVTGIGGDTTFGTSEFCSEPRFGATESSWYNPLQSINIRSTVIYNPSCRILERNDVIYDNVTCQQFQGCVWEERAVSWFNPFTWFRVFGDDYGCYGEIDSEYYNDGVEIGFDRYGILWNQSVCSMYDCQLGQFECEMFGCTWYTPELIDEINQTSSFRQIFNLVMNIFMFRIEIDSQVGLINILLAFLFVYLPLIILAGITYIMLR